MRDFTAKGTMPTGAATMCLIGGDGPPVNDCPDTSSDTGLWRRGPAHGSEGVLPLRSPVRGIPPSLSGAALKYDSEVGCTRSGAIGRSSSRSSVGVIRGAGMSALAWHLDHVRHAACCPT